MLSSIGSALIPIFYLLGSFTTIQSYICQPPTSPAIVSPENNFTHPINSAFTVTGTGPTESSIILTDNGNDIISVQANESNQFSASVVLTSEGEHTIGVKSVRPCGQALGNEITVIGGPALPVDPIDPIDPVDPTNPVTPTNPLEPSTPTNPTSPNTDSSEPPTTSQPEENSDDQGTSNGLFLSISGPTNNSTTADSSVFVSGSTNKPATVSISVNGTVTSSTLAAQTIFGMSTPLTIGENTIIVNAKGESGSASVKLTIHRENPSKELPWHQTEQGRLALRVVVISLIGLMLVAVILGIALA